MSAKGEKKNVDLYIHQTVRNEKKRFN
jgi:hypothetical protein